MDTNQLLSLLNGLSLPSWAGYLIAALLPLVLARLGVKVPLLSPPAPAPVPAPGPVLPVPEPPPQFPILSALLAAWLKAKGMGAVECVSHLPADDLKRIRDEADAAIKSKGV